jgi:acyl-CoA oxidase
MSFIRSGMLRYTDMRDAPERFFAAHRLLASMILGGYGIRFTVQFNLFAGSILGLGNTDQVALLETLQRKGDLGCFALTEVGAGVLSGFIVQTVATYDRTRNGFTLHTPTPSAEKNWISQGLLAHWVVVFAELVLDSNNLGPHPFLMRIRDADTGDLVPGLTAIDMGSKTVANDLDNARLSFDHVFVPHSALLDRFAGIDQGVYTQRTPERMRIEVIGQRLLTGRLAIAESALVAVRQLFMKTRSYAETKLVHGITGQLPLANLPHLAELFSRADQQLTQLEVFTACVEARLALCLRTGLIPDADLVEAIAVCKVRNVDIASALEHTLEHEVGSYALMANSGFIYKDMLLCCKFAEGDSRILKQKMARDELKRVQKRGWWVLLKTLSTERDKVRLRLAHKSFRLLRALRSAKSLSEGFVQEWQQVYALAEAVCDLHVHLRPRGEEVARVLRGHPDLMPALQEPLLVSRL